MQILRGGPWYTFLSQINTDGRRDAAVLDAVVITILVSVFLGDGLESDARLELGREAENFGSEVADGVHLRLVGDQGGAGVDEPEKFGHQSDAHVREDYRRQVVLNIIKDFLTRRDLVSK